MLPLSKTMTDFFSQGETKLYLNKSGSVTLDSAGEGTVELSVGALERWKITILNTSGNSTAQPKLTVLRKTDSRQLDYTVTGNGDTSSADIELRQGEAIQAVYTGGTAGAIMTFSITGDIYLRGRRGY